MILQGDARHIPLANKSVHCVVTSPPFWGLRDYGVNGQLGLEKTPEEYVAKLVEVFREVRRVLRDDGTLWVNLGDTYAATRSYQVTDNKNPAVGPSRHLGHAKPPDGYKQKDMIGIPWRVAFALQADGWWLRSDIIWAKPNPMPESVRDRPTKSHEYLFLLSKSKTYYYDAEAIKEPRQGPEPWGGRAPDGKAEQAESQGRHGSTSIFKAMTRAQKMRWYGDGRNRRSVWTIATEPYSGAHFATFPRKLVEPCILAGTSARGCCAACRAPWERIFESTSHTNRREPAHAPRSEPSKTDSSGWGPMNRATGEWHPTCSCAFSNSVPCIVLDPFVGSGTTVAVAESLGRRGIGIDLKAEYLALAKHRLRGVTLGLPI